MSNEEYSECLCENVIEQDSLLVCQDCGNVVRDTPELRWDTKCVDQKDFNKRSMLKRSSDYLARPKRVTETVQHGLELIQRLASLLDLSQNISKGACETYKSLSNDDIFKYRQTQTKQCMAIWCLYLISRRSGTAISLSQIAGSCDIICDISHLSTTYTLLRKHFPDLISFVDILDLVPLSLENFAYKSNEKRTIINLTKELIELLQKAALIQGYNPIFVIQSLSFLIWKTLDSKRLNHSYRQYCNQLHVQYYNTTNQNILFYTKMLIELYKCSPEYIEQPNLEKIILVKIPDLLRTKNITVFNFNKSHPEHIGKKRSRATDCTEKAETEVYDDDFSDTEIEQYLKSDQEISKVLKCL